MAKISLICEQCGGHIILDDSHEIGTCEYCYAQFVIKKDEISLHKSCTEKIWECSIMGTDKCIDIWKYLKNVYAASTGYTD